MISDKIRMYREFRGLNQIQLAELSGINVNTIRKYETGIRNPKPDQLKKIASALGLNYSVFFDFKLETAGDIMSLLFIIDDAVDISFCKKIIGEESDNKNSVSLQFEHEALSSFIKDWAEFKQALAKADDDALAQKDVNMQNDLLNKNASMYEEWKLRKMGTDIYSNIVVTKDTTGITIKNTQE